jgi:hypothetical protein
MWVLKNKITDEFFCGFSSENYIQTTRKKEYAEYYIMWTDAAEDRRLLTENWAMVPVDEL